MRAVDVNATIGPEGATITLPRLSVVVETAQARRLRDALNAVLPERIEDLLHDPRVTDLNVLQAAQTLLAERRQDTENLAFAIDSMQRKGTPERVKRLPRLMLLTIMGTGFGGTAPELGGPYDTEAERLEAAREYRRAHGPEDGVFRADIYPDGKVELASFSFSELPTGPRRCVLCQCAATGERFGFAVCAYHTEHTEDDPQCPHCMTADEELLADGRELLRETREPVPVLTDSAGKHYCHACTEQTAAWGLHDEHPEPGDEWWCTTCGCGVTAAAWEREANGRQIKRGDRVRDPHGGEWRTVARVENTTVHMTDGGCMSIDECRDVRLPSEGLD